MEKYAVVACLLVACSSVDPPPLGDREVVESAASLWADTYGWPEACEAALPELQLRYVPFGEACIRDRDACALPLQDTIIMTTRGFTYERRVWLLVHESAHLFMSCSFRAPSGDPQHTADDVWQGWVETTAHVIQADES